VRVRKLTSFIAPFSLFLIIGCNPQEEPKGKTKTKFYSSAKLEMVALENKYLKEIDILLRKKLPNDIRESLLLVRDFIAGKLSDSYKAYEAIEKIEKSQVEGKLKLFSPFQLREIKELIEMKAKYSTPPIA